MRDLIPSPDEQGTERQFSAVQIFRLDMRADPVKPVGQETELLCRAAIHSIPFSSLPQAGGG